MENNSKPEQDYLDVLREHAEEGLPFTEEELDIIADLAVDSIRNILGFFDIEDTTIDEYEEDDGGLVLDIKGDNLAVLIGRHGKTLEALQVLMSALCTSKLGFFYPVTVDIGGYKARRKAKLQSIARSSAARAKKKQGVVKLAPMTPYERRLIHLALRDDNNVTTHSEGEEPNRCVIITWVR